MNRAGVTYARCDRDELREAIERDALDAAVLVMRVRFAFGCVLEFGDRRRRRVDVRGEQSDDLLAPAELLVAKLAEKRVEQKGLAARELADDGKQKRRAF